MKKVFQMVFRLSLVSFASLLNLGAVSLYAAEPELVPPAQDYYLHFDQSPTIKIVVGELGPYDHQLAAVDTPGDLIVSNALTVEAWVLWKDSDLEEIQSATGIDTDRMTLLCGQGAYGFRYRSDGIEGWTFFLQTEEGVFPDTGNIPLPLGQWTHLAATYDGTTIRTFLNGNQQTEMAASGNILTLGDAFTDVEDCFRSFPEAGIFGIGQGFGFRGGIRQLRIWNRVLPGSELASNAGLHLDGTEPGLVGYWPLDGPPDPLQAPNKVAGSPPLLFRLSGHSPEWHLTDPLFIVREDLAEDVLVTDCPSLPSGFNSSWLVDVQDDGDLDLIFLGTTGLIGVGLVPFRALVRDGENGFVFDTPGAIAGTVPFAQGNMRGVTADFNGDGRLDVFAANTGEDYGDTAGAPNTLLLSRPDGRLEDASGNLLGPPCTADTPQFEGQHMCYAGGDFGGRTPGVRYPGTGAPVPPDPDFTHGVAAGDTDGDGDVDILVGNVPNHLLEQPYLLINDGQGEFLANWQLVPDFMIGSSLEEEVAYPIGFLMEDMDGDGHVDLVTGPAAFESHQGAPHEGEWIGGISWNDGSGDFSSAERMVIIPTESIPGEHKRRGQNSSGAMLAVDIDNDSDKDLLVSWDAYDNSGTNPTSLQILVNQGGRVFVDETVARVGAPPQASMPLDWILRSYAEDFNQDGCPDLLFQNDTFYPNLIWFNDCQGNFTPQAAPPLPKLGSSYIPLDFDGDGDTDLISAIPKWIHYAGTQGCSEGELVAEDEATDYIDFAVLLNQSPSNFKINAGHSGAWYDSETSGQGQLIDIEPESQFIFLSWFTFTDATSANPNEQHWFTAQGNYSGNKAELILYETLGGRFDDPQDISNDPVGEVILNFTDCDLGQMNYTIDTWELQGSIPLQRAIPGTENVCQERTGINTEPLDLNDGWDGAWFDEETPGQGFLIDVHPNPEGDDFIFVAWFTYGENTASGQRWLTAQGPLEGTTADIVVYETTGGSFDEPITDESNPVGSMTIDFNDCSNAKITYSMTDEGLEGSIDIKRAIPGTEALCQELATQNE